MINHKTIYLLLCFILLNRIEAQSNLNLNNWSFFINSESPDNWVTLNPILTTGDSISCEKSLDCVEGDYSAKIRSIYIKSINDMLFPGQLIQFGIPDGNYTKISFAYKFPSIHKDTSLAIISLYKGKISDTNNRIGYAQIVLDTCSQWQYSSTNIYRKSYEMPDTILISFFTGFYSANNWLYIDDISLSQTQNNLNSFDSSTIQVYNNNKILYTGDLLYDRMKIAIYNQTGSKLSSFSIEKHTHYDLSTLKDGNYYYEILREDGRLVHYTGNLFLHN